MFLTLDRLRKDISDVIEMLSKCKDDKGEEKPCYEALIIITSLVTSCARYGFFIYFFD